MGARLDGTKELIAVADGYRESTDSWAEVLRDLRRRGMRAPMVAVGDGALGLWAALGEVFPPDPAATLLGSQGGQCPGGYAEVGPFGRAPGIG